MSATITAADPAIVARIRKMLDKAERTNNPHEADAFAAKAADLIARHRVSVGELSQASHSPATMTVAQVSVGRGAYVRARISLLVGIADAHDVRAVYEPRPRGSVVFLAGRSQDVELVEVLYTSLHNQAARHMATIRSSTGASTQRERRAFLFGFAARIGELLEVANRRARSDAETARGSGSVELALRDRRAQVDDFATAQWGRVRSASRPAPVSPSGYVRGEAAADRADLGRSAVQSQRAIGVGR